MHNSAFDDKDPALRPKKGSRQPPRPVTTVNPLPVLDEVCRIVDGPADAQAKLSAALESLARNLHMSRGAITLLAPGTQDIHIEIAYGLKPLEQSRGHYQSGEGVTGLVIQSGKVMIVPDVAREPRFLNRTGARDLLTERIAFFCVPLKADDQAIGALSLESSGLIQEQEQEIVSLLGVAASLLSPYALRHQRSMRPETRRRNGAEHEAARALRPLTMIGTSPGLMMVQAQIAQAAPSETPVLLRGESGTGKELAAGAIHDASPRAHMPFVSFNCAAMPEHLVENELFGREHASSEAESRRKCSSELARGGTLFLDEVDVLPPQAQAGLLRALQAQRPEGGGLEPLAMDVRIIAASSVSLEQMVEQGLFLRELYHQLAVFPIHLPPLRERMNDILLLAKHFMERFAEKNAREGVHLSLSVMDMLHLYSWPGNVRELHNVMERAVLLVGKDGLILPRHLPPELHSRDYAPNGSTLSGSSAEYTLQERLDELERAGIMEALEMTGGHMGQAAAHLGLTERIMALRMKKYDIRYQDFRNKARR